MKSLAFLEQVEHERKVAIYAAEHDGKTRNFAYHEDFGECRETFARLFQDVQKGEIGVIMTSDAACLSVETSPDWMEAFIQVVKQHKVLMATTATIWSMICAMKRMRHCFGICIHKENTRKREAGLALSSTPLHRALSLPPLSRGVRTGSW